MSPVSQRSSSVGSVGSVAATVLMLALILPSAVSGGGRGEDSRYAVSKVGAVSRVGGGVGFAAAGAVSTYGTAEPALDWSRNLALLVLDVERQWLGEQFAGRPGKTVRVSDGSTLLVQLLAAAEQRVRAGGDPGSQRPLAVLLAIHSVLAEAGITYGEGNPGSSGAKGRPLCQGLIERRFDCAMYIWFYLGVAERLGLPLAAIGLPGHVALRWLDVDGGHLNWEATVPDLRDDAFYLAWKQPAAEAVQQGVYLRDLDRQEVAAIAYYRVSQVLSARKEYRTARAAVERALALLPDFPDAHNLEGLILARSGATDLALTHFDRAIALDPHFTHAYLNRANYRLDRGDFAGARSDLAVLRELEHQLTR